MVPGTALVLVGEEWGVGDLVGFLGVVHDPHDVLVQLAEGVLKGGETHAGEELLEGFVVVVFGHSKQVHHCVVMNQIDLACQKRIVLR